MTDEQILARLTEVLTRDFDVKPDAVRWEAHLFEDLDLDSIDAIDLAVTLEEEAAVTIEEEELRAIRRVRDVVELIQRKLPKA